MWVSIDVFGDLQIISYELRQERFIDIEDKKNQQQDVGSSAGHPDSLLVESKTSRELEHSR